MAGVNEGDAAGPEGEGSVTTGGKLILLDGMSDKVGKAGGSVAGALPRPLLPIQLNGWVMVVVPGVPVQTLPRGHFAGYSQLPYPYTNWNNWNEWLGK